MKNVVCILLFLSISAVTAEGTPQFPFRHFLSIDGLPVNTITCSTSDHLGYLWFGTRDGVCRFDGCGFTHLEYDGSESPANGIIFSISEDIDGRVWFCSVNGTGYYNIYTGEMSKADSLSSYRFNDINTDGSGNVWFTSDHLIVKRERDTGRFTIFDSDNACSAIHSAQDYKGDIWFTSRYGGIFRYKSAIDSFSDIIRPSILSKDEFPECIAVLDETHLILSTSRNRILLFNIQTEKAMLLTQTEGEINCLVAKTSVEIWIGTTEGTLIYDRLKDDIQPVYQTTGSEMSQNITCILKDKEGYIWSGTYYGGLYVWNSVENSITRMFDTGKDGCFKGHLTHSFAPDGGSHVWIGTEDGILNRMNTADMSFTTPVIKGNIPDDLNIHGLLPDGERLWIASFNRGIYQLDTRTGICSKHKRSPSDTCVCISRLKDGTILLGTREGLYKYDRPKDSFVFINGTGQNFIYTVYQDSGKNIWVGTFGNGLFKSDDSMESFSHIEQECDDCSPFPKYITAILEDSQKNIWIASDGTGLHKFSSDLSILSHISKKTGLPSDIVTSLTQDREGNLWVSTTRGLTVIDPHTSTIKKTFIDYSGTTGNQYINGAGSDFTDGRMFFGTTNGFVTFKPSSIIDPLSEAPLYFRKITAEGKLKRTNLTEDGKSVSFSEKLKLKEKDAELISISFSTPYFSDLYMPQYEITLKKGQKELIHNITSDNTISFSGLRPGSYKLYVKLTESLNSEASKTLSFRITPPIQRSAAAIIFYIALILGAIFSLIYTIFSRKITEEEHKLKMVESLKQQEISESKIDFMTEITQQIRTPLSLIKMPIEKIIGENDYTDSSKEDIFTIKKHTDKLLELTDKFMEIRSVNKKPVRTDSSPAADAPNQADNEMEESSVHTDTSGKQTILVVEDEADMRLYLMKELSLKYNILSASNGEEAVEVIRENKVDLVVSDIMMPLMDGCELCNFIKSNVEYSHIPVILLTAVVGVETRIETLESGADGYIEKPFKMELLQANISNLFRNKEISYKQFADSPLSHFKSTSTNKVENAFMEKLHATVMKHMADQELGIDMLTDILGTSKTTLYRKIKSNTGLNTNEYIRLCRLKKAADMLSSQEYRINEVAYLTGFSSPSYFATSFQKQFNISPSAFVKNLK